MIESSPTVAPCGVVGGVAPHHEPAQAMAHTGSADGVTVLPETVRDLIGWANRALVYLEHPDVQAMGFAAHPEPVAFQLRAAIARAQGGVQ